MWTLTCWLQNWIQQAAAWGYIEIILQINRLKLFMHVENNICVFNETEPNILTYLCIYWKYFPSKGFYYFQNTVFLIIKKSPKQQKTKNVIWCFFLKTFFFFSFQTVKENRVQMVARTLAIANLKTFQRISLWTTLTQDTLGSFLCSWNGQKVLVTSLTKNLKNK